MGAWQCAILWRYRAARFHWSSPICTGSADRRHHPYSRLARTRSRCGRGLGSALSLKSPMLAHELWRHGGSRTPAEVEEALRSGTRLNPFDLVVWRGGKTTIGAYVEMQKP